MADAGTSLTVGWLSRTIGRPVTSIASTRIGTDRGFAGVVLRVEITSGEGRSSLIAKVGPDPSLDTEVMFYQRLAQELDAPSPRCVYAGPGPDAEPLLLLDDLSLAREGDALTGAPVDDVAAVLDSMAGLWRHRANPPTSAPLPPWGGDPKRRQDRFRQNWVAQREALTGELPADIWQIADRLVTSLADVAVDLKKAPARVVHADLHMDNVLFVADRPVVLDWGSVCLGSPAVDVFAFISSSLSPADQQAHFTELVEQLGLDAATVDDGRRRLLCALAGVIGWRNRAPSCNPREGELRAAALADGRLINALRHWDAARVLP